MANETNKAESKALRAAAAVHWIFVICSLQNEPLVVSLKAAIDAKSMPQLLALAVDVRRLAFESRRFDDRRSLDKLDAFSTALRAVRLAEAA